MREVLEDQSSPVYFSVTNLWEIVIKTSPPRRDLQVDPKDARREALGFGFRELQITAKHAFAVRARPAIHKDPFDRLLIAQARAEGMELLTVDTRVQRYLAQ